MAAGKLYDIQGGVLAHAEQDVTPITRDEIVVLSKMHEIAQKYHLSLVCKRCDSAFVGQNNDSSDKLAVACKCRELRYTR